MRTSQRDHQPVGPGNTDALQRDQRRRDPGAQCRHTEPVQPARGRYRGAANKLERQQDSDHAEWDVHDEQPAPRGHRGDRPAQRRTDNRRRQRRPREKREIAAGVRPDRLPRNRFRCAGSVVPKRSDNGDTATITVVGRSRATSSTGLLVDRIDTRHCSYRLLHKVFRVPIIFVGQVNLAIFIR